MVDLLVKIRRLFTQGDIMFYIFEKYSFFIGSISIRWNKFIYGNRLNIQFPFKVWGNIRFLFLGEGSITIGKNFHAVSSRRRSAITLFSPCHLNIINNGQIILGNHVGLNGNTITARRKITIGDNTMIGPNTIIIDHDGHQAWPPEARWIQSGLSKEIIIENDVWIGMNCMILKGVRIREGSIIAAGSVVIHDVDANSLYAGNPARKIKSLFVDS
jgi:acetyltransferase-like isoleucine patch superfamily enzyme